MDIVGVTDLDLFALCSSLKVASLFEAGPQGFESSLCDSLRRKEIKVGALSVIKIVYCKDLGTFSRLHRASFVWAEFLSLREAKNRSIGNKPFAKSCADYVV